jgi:polyribonucleotide nucleotidyltransferase
MQRVERTFAGRRLMLETGRMAKQAAGSAVVQFGDTVVLAAVTVSDNTSPLPFFPLTVEYRDKSYAAGKIPGGFIKREGRPLDAEILKARIVDRTVRPLFPDGFKNEIQVYIYVVSADQENDADVLAVVATSIALNTSRIPFSGPIAAVRMGRVQDKWVLNPTFAQLEYSELDMVVSGSRDSIVMVEGSALELPEPSMVEALSVSHRGIRELIEIQEELFAKVERREKMQWTPRQIPEDLEVRVRDLVGGKLREALNRILAEVIEDESAWDSITATREQDVPVLVFGPHKDVEGLRAAKQAGVSRVVANSQFHREMPVLIERYGYTVLQNILRNGRCPQCQARIPGVWC